MTICFMLDNNFEKYFSEQSSNQLEEGAVGNGNVTENGTCMALTNSLIHNEPYLDEYELNTTKDRKSYFVIYSKVNEFDVGCEYTFRSDGKNPRYECKKCRSLHDKDKKLGIAVESPAAITISATEGHQIKDVKKSTHHPQCRVEYSGTALARSQKNVAVVFKSKYGGSSKNVYDSHLKMLNISSDCLTAADVSRGFGTFEYATSALKKSSKRKSAIQYKHVNVGEGDTIEKMSTHIMRSTHNEPDDYFLIGQNDSVIVLGSKFLIERFFRSKICMSDGTFKMAPKGYTQSYMLWYVAEGMCKEELVARSKAMLAVNFVLKGKSEAVYKSAFDILEDYRKGHNIPDPLFEEYITDDEPAVRKVVAQLYPSTTFSLCLFHHNQNIVKCLAQHKLSNFIRKCNTDEQYWFYGKMKQILVIPLLPPIDVIPAFKSLSSTILKFIEDKFSNPYEVEQFRKFFSTIEERYFSNPEKIELTNKYRKTTRSTNLIESTHCVFNKSSVIPKHGTVSNFVDAMTIIDLEYRTTAIAFEEKGASVFPKKKKRYTTQQATITECTEDLAKNKIGVEDFLKKCSEALIHEKYFKLIEAATERIEKSPDSEEDNANIDETLMAIFATSESTHGRIRSLCSKYFGNDWLN